MWRRTAREASTELEAREPNPRVEAMRETLTVWNPFADELLAHWLETMEDGRVAARFPEGWRKRGRALLSRYDELALLNRRATKHRKPKENLAIMRAALREAVERPLTEELAADIFMGRFSEKFLRAAERAGDRLAGSLYARHYDIDYDSLPRTLEEFAELCVARAGGPSDRWSVAGNRRVIEQAQILTTPNLAPRTSIGLDLDYPSLAARAQERALVFAARGDGAKHRHALRQHMFFLSLNEV